jgi:hypothetical protein
MLKCINNCCINICSNVSIIIESELLEPELIESELLEPELIPLTLPFNVTNTILDEPLAQDDINGYYIINNPETDSQIKLSGEDTNTNTLLKINIANNDIGLGNQHIEPNQRLNIQFGLFNLSTGIIINDNTFLISFGFTICQIQPNNNNTDIDIKFEILNNNILVDINNITVNGSDASYSVGSTNNCVFIRDLKDNDEIVLYTNKTNKFNIFRITNRDDSMSQSGYNFQICKLNGIVCI